MECNSVPSPAQLALALAIVKLKPTGLDIKEHILQVRESIKSSETTGFFHVPERFFDSVSFWRQAYEKSESEKSTLLDRIFELEQRNEELMEKLHYREEAKDELVKVDDGKTSREQNSLKRTMDNSQSARKRPRKQLNIFGDASEADIQALDIDMKRQMGTSKKPTIPFVRHSYILRKTLQKRFNKANIAQAAVVLCKHCEEEVTTSVTSSLSKAKLEREALPLPLALRSIEPAITLVYQALKRLSKNEGSREIGVLIYHIVCLYEAILNCLRQVCKAHATPTNPTKTSYPVLTRSKTMRPAKPSTECDSQPAKEDEGALCLTSLLDRMVHSLDLNCPEHQRVLEGFLYVLLSHAGKTLCLFTFQDLQLRPDLRTNTEELPLPAGMADADLDGKSLGAAQVEAKYFVWLLRRASAVLDQHPSESENCSEVHILPNMKAKLKSTLIQAVFGDDLESGRPLEPPKQPRDRDIKKFLEDKSPPELSIPEWYIQELWQLIGWDGMVKFDPV